MPVVTLVSLPQRDKIPVVTLVSLLRPFRLIDCEIDKSKINALGGRAGRHQKGRGAHDESRSGPHLGELLVRMYTGWAESKGFTVNVIEQVRERWYRIRCAFITKMVYIRMGYLLSKGRFY